MKQHYHLPHPRLTKRGLPDVVFTDPQLAQPGMTEAQALAAWISAIVDCSGSRTCRADPSTTTRAVPSSSWRIDKTGKVLGVHALADGAGDLILAGVYAIKFGLTVNDLATTWVPYLTMSEALRLVAQSFHHPVDQLSCCAA